MSTKGYHGWTELELTPVPGDNSRFVGEIGPQWHLLVVAHGGVVAAMAARAMALALDRPEQTLRSISAVFAGQVSTGPVEIDVTVLRSGRSMSQATATVRNPGAEAGLTAVAVFGTSRRGYDFTELTFPDVEPPDALLSFRDPVPAGIDFEFERELPRFWAEVIDAKPAMGAPPWEPFEPGPAEMAYWYRFDHPPVGPDGLVDGHGLIVLCDTMPGAVGERVGHEESWFGPSADLTVHTFGSAEPGWFLAHNRARYAGDGYASVDLALWTADRRLVAYATQTMFFAFGAW